MRECNDCGECCRFIGRINLNEKERKTFNDYYFDNFGIVYLPKLGNITISLFPWEARTFMRIAEEKKVKLNLLPKRVILDSKKKLMIIVDYYVHHNICPFYSEKEFCTVYSDRPIVCRSFPVTKFDFKSIAFGKCDFAKEETKGISGTARLFRRFSNSATNALQQQIILEWQYSKILTLLGKKLINPVKKTGFVYEAIDLDEFLINNDLLENFELESMIKRIEKCEDAKVLIKEKGIKAI
ncbi:MAG TPA: YkgJ family cysteine cluster protein [Candidatus Nanoarchaeia archaeon]|nr:YkgJ family cysteine cluster protein [Candidatus Nanoarchaeia archaeon]